MWLLACLVCAGCNRTATASTEEAKPKTVNQPIGNFSADSAYNYIADQVAFGPRVPGTDGHKRCAQYLQTQLQKFGAEDILVQNATVTAHNGDELPITNIMGRYCITSPRRILLVAHWDTRPWADQETHNELRNKPIPGANDGGSGVGVLLEIARNLGQENPSVGVDILFVDAEDYGTNDGFLSDTDSWCLGTQYWVKNMPYSPEEMPEYGILLDMVGGRDAIFHREHFSHINATRPTDKVWNEAAGIGMGDILINAIGGAVTDDHVFLTQAGIPTTDIIESLNSSTSSFPPTWHTHDDNMDNISTTSLDAVGKTVLSVIYKESAI